MAFVDIVAEPAYACWLKKASMIFLSVIAMMVKGRYREYGLTADNVWLSIKWGLIILLIFVVLAAAMLFVLGKVVIYNAISMH